MAKDETVPGLTGKPVPKPKSAKKQYELEKKRREARHLGTNVGGVQYRPDVSPYYNPRARTYREFLEIVEAKQAKPPQEVLNKISKAYSRKHRGVNVSASAKKSGDIRLDDIWIPPSERNKGIGSRAMKGLTKYADKQGKRITLNQAPEPGKKEKLKQFYQKHGFKPNTGRSRDLSVSDTHIRNPQT